MCQSSNIKMCVVLGAIAKKRNGVIGALDIKLCTSGPELGKVFDYQPPLSTIGLDIFESSINFSILLQILFLNFHCINEHDFYF
jgi:hypothetical protein